ncbi:MAG: NYN domain-containing protein [Planctomycetota bacterium]|nr:NYN domain-containing protein [Planctomycetota bacterium]
MSKAARLLIDGYNLLFQSSVVGRGRGPGWLQQARLRMLHFLKNRLSDDEFGYVQVVFDASTSPIESASVNSAEQSLGVQVLFASKHDEADDLLEELIRGHPHPKTLTVVSSDHRVQRCARARKARVLDAEEYWDSLEERSVAPPESNDELPSNSEPDVDAFEVDYWLREFDQDS